MSAFASGVYAGDIEISTLYAGETEITGLRGCEDTIYVPDERPLSVDVLLVGGGAGGGTSLGGGGGGAGGHREYTKIFYTNTTYNLTVGAGGSASSGTASSANGSNSSIERIADGGGGGGTGGIGSDGGSGGGGYAISSSDGGDSKTTQCNRPSQGNAGSAGNGAFAQAGGGGGSSSSGGSNGDGGAGSASSITGSSVTRAGGGGGGDTNGGFGGTATPGSGGSGGGGVGGTGNQSSNSSQATGGNGSANTGGGGGGGAFYKDGGSNLSGSGGNGGSGFVCIKYSTDFSCTVGNGLTHSSSTSGGFHIKQFTAGTDTISFSAVEGGGAGAYSISLVSDGSNQTQYHAEVQLTSLPTGATGYKIEMTGSQGGSAFTGVVLSILSPSNNSLYYVNDQANLANNTSDNGPQNKNMYAIYRSATNRFEIYADGDNGSDNVTVKITAINDSYTEIGTVSNTLTNIVIDDMG